MHFERRKLLLGGLALACACSSASEEEAPPILLGDGEHGPRVVGAGQTLDAEPGATPSIVCSGPGAALIVHTAAGQVTHVRNLIIHSHGGAAIVGV